MNLMLVAILIGFDLFAAAALALSFFLGKKTPTQTRLAEITYVPNVEAEYGLRDLLSYISRPLKPLRPLLRLKGDEALERRLSLAGYRDPEDVDFFLDAKLLCPILGILVATFIGGDNALFYYLGLAAAGYFAPDLFISKAMRRRKQSFALSLPNALDLLVICMEAGLGMDQAILAVAKELRIAAPPLSEELQILSREQRAGKSKVDAWWSLAERVDLDSVRQFASMLTQSERLGTPVSRTLAQFADMLRAKRLTEIEEQAAKTTVKLIFPLVLFIFPAMFVVILGPAAIVLSKAFE